MPFPFHLTVCTSMYIQLLNVVYEKRTGDNISGRPLTGLWFQCFLTERMLTFPFLQIWQLWTIWQVAWLLWPLTHRQNKCTGVSQCVHCTASFICHLMGVPKGYECVLLWYIYHLVCGCATYRTEHIRHMLINNVGCVRNTRGNRRCSHIHPEWPVTSVYSAWWNTHVNCWEKKTCSSLPPKLNSKQSCEFLFWGNITQDAEIYCWVFLCKMC